MDKNDKTEGLLGGFKPILGAFSNDFEGVENPFASTNDMVDDLTDEEIEALKAKSAPPVPPVKEGKTKTEQVDEDEDEDDDDDDTTPVQIETKESTEDDDSNEEPTETVTALFDAIAEELNWTMDEEDKKPTNVEDLVAYFKDVIEENSVPVYANDEVKEIDEFVRNGGKLQDYFKAIAPVEYDNIDITKEDNQKKVLKEYLKTQGYNDTRIDRKLERYEDAGVLEEEAEEALEFLKDASSKNKERLLEEQETFARQQREEQQKYIDSVVKEINSITEIRGIKIPKEDKARLAEYMFKPDSSGQTQYVKDFVKDPKNVIGAAYFTMKGDALLGAAKNEGNTKAMQRLKNSLKSTGAGKNSKKITTSSSDSLWVTVARQLGKQ
ncbi:MAG: hypothetical protein EOM41_10385 [Bacilli bacterium]|nr:hypothetical protein [Bacilli bacterium]